MPPQSKTLFTLKGKNKWPGSNLGRKLGVTSCSSEVKMIRALTSRHSKQGLGFMSPPGANTPRRTVGRPSRCRAARPSVLARGGCPPSHRHHSYFFWITFPSTSRSSLFFGFFPILRFCDPFFMVSPPFLSLWFSSRGSAFPQAEDLLWEAGNEMGDAATLESRCSGRSVFSAALLPESIPEVPCLEEPKPGFFSWG